MSETILVNLPGSEKKGGVLSHYEGLKPYLTSFRYAYNMMGNRSNKYLNIFLFPFELIQFIIKLIFCNPKVIVLNPSLYPGIFHRDALLLWFSKLFKKRVVVFFHGWYEFYEQKISSKTFNFYYGNADTIIVLSNKFKSKIEEWNFKNDIILSTTKVSDSLVDGYSLSNLPQKPMNLLFLARLEEYKGIFIALEAFRLLKKDFPSLSFTVVGDGSARIKVESEISRLGLTDVMLKGHLEGESIKNEFSLADLYIFPSYSEGMPASVLEAMAFGLPIISRDVGGLKDFFVDGKMGYLIESFTPMDFYLKINDLMLDNELYRNISENNYKYAHENFLASKVAFNIEKIFKSYLN